MGLVSLGTNTFWNRILMFFMQPSKYPLEPYTMYMQPRRMHLFTAIQLGLFVLLYTVKAIKTIAIAFPLIIACCIPIRLYLLPKIFTEKELTMIDSDEEAVKNWLLAHAKVGDETQKAPEGDESTLQPDVVSKPDVEEGGGVDIETGEKMDLVLPLPTEELETAESRRRARHKRRKKSVSCPTPQLMFADIPYTGPTSIQLAVVEEDTTSERSEEDEALIRTAADAPRRRRPRRVKTMSCPSHILRAEADRQIKSNYFFG